MSDNGHENGEVTVKFGDAAGNVLSPEWAGLVLAEIRKTETGMRLVGDAIGKVAAREMAGVELFTKAPPRARP